LAKKTLVAVAEMLRMHHLDDFEGEVLGVNRAGRFAPHCLVFCLGNIGGFFVLCCVNGWSMIEREKNDNLQIV
jgi:hypothetical protein